MDRDHSLIARRLEKLEAFRQAGIDPFANRFAVAETCEQALRNFEEGRETALAGRIVSHRVMGKSQFLHIQDQSGRLQLYAQKQTLGDKAFQQLRDLDLGDIIGVSGQSFTTRTQEKSLKLASFTVLSKALRPPPDKWSGLENPEIRYRQRYLDLIANEETRNVFQKRSRIVWEIRQFLHSRGFMEVETPIMQTIPGGAAARTFVTRHQALNCDFHLRIAIELHLKRLLVGGFDRVYEIGRNFRNEGLSRRHNPEFTMLEVYQTYGDYRTMMELLQSMIRQVAERVIGSQEIPAKDGKSAIDLKTDWRRVRYRDLIRERMGTDWFDLEPAERRSQALELDLEIRPDCEDYEITNAVFEKLIEPNLIQPTFVTHLPKELVPLAKLSPDDPSTVEVFECCINGQEIAPAYSEQNDPVEQRARLEEQAGGERQKLDEDFLIALEHGMPPAGGMGIGIDRLCMTLLSQDNIRDVILFPQMKPEHPESATADS